MNKKLKSIFKKFYLPDKLNDKKLANFLGYQNHYFHLFQAYKIKNVNLRIIKDESFYVQT